MKISVSTIFKVSLLFFFLNSMYMWVTWHAPTHYIGVVVLFVMLIYFKLEKVKLAFTFQKLIGALALLLGSYLGHSFEGIVPFVGHGFIVLPCLFLLFVDEAKIHTDLLDFITSFFALLLPISFIVFILSFMGLPRIGVLIAPSDFYPPYDNFLLSVRTTAYNVRFNSIFLEPGHLGMILAYLLYAQKFNFKKDKRLIVILVFAVFTLSLAAYVLILLGYVINLFAHKRLRFDVMFSGLLFLGLLYLVAVNYNNGENLLNEYFFERLQPSEDKGFSGNNRTYGYLDQFYELAIEHKELVLWGIGVKNYNFISENYYFGGAGIKVFVLRHGLISVLLVFGAYLLMGLSLSKNRRYVLGFVLLFAFSFWQRAYPFWASWLILFMTGIAQSQQQIDEKKI